jgi:dTDP-4-dehydrorhamnose reductase
MSNLKLVKQKILLTGANGLLGQKLIEYFSPDFEILAVDLHDSAKTAFAVGDYTRCDLTQRDAIYEVIKRFRPHYVINTAAYTDVDGSEEHKEVCWKVNAISVEHLANAAKAVAAPVIHLSTDYVFDGLADRYTEESRPNPLGYYGRSKLAGENLLIGSGADWTIVRTMVLYGVAIDVAPNFATWLVEQLGNNKTVRIVDDQYGHPTISDDLASAILQIVQQRKTGMYHVAGSDYVSRLDFAHCLADVFDFDRSLICRIKTDELAQKALRPMRSRFDLSKAENELGITTRDMKSALELFKQQLQKDKTARINEKNADYNTDL